MGECVIACCHPRILKMPRFQCVLCVLAVASCAFALDNGVRLPPMGWSSWYGFTQNIDEGMIRGMADGMVSSGLREVGYEHIWIDDGWALPRDNTTGKPGVDPKIFPSGMRNLSDYIHARQLKFGIYTSKGPLTCLGYQPTQPQRPGSCGFEQVDADTYAHDWQVDQVKDDGCGQCPQDEAAGGPFVAMRDALNKTGRRIVYAIHSDGTPWNAGSDSNGSVANMWRTGGDLSASSYAMWLDRLDLATDDRMRPFVGPGAIANPDFLEVGYTPRQPKGRAGIQSLVERRSMFTMWAMLPAPLILSADLRPGAPSGGIDDAAIRAILTNREVIAVNQDALVAPMQPVRRGTAAGGVEVWRKPLASGGMALVLFNRNVSDAPAPVVAGMPLAPRPCGQADLAFDFAGGALRVRVDTSGAANALCVGRIDVCACANPPSPRLGLVPCDGGDATQHWAFDNLTGQINNNGSHDLNTGPQCAGDADRSMLLYPTQGHANEKFAYDPTTGVIRQQGGGSCLARASATPTPQDGTVSIGVTWAELGLPNSTRVAVRDLWNATDLGVHTRNFAALIGRHEARIFTLTPDVV